MNERIRSVDFFRVIAILCVIIIHTNPFNGFDGSILYKYLHVILNQSSRFAVPFFFVISGFFYGNKIHNSTDQESYTILRLKNLFILWVVWSVIYILPYNINSLFSYGLLGPIKIIYWNCIYLLSNPEKLILEGSKVHLWFINSLIWSTAICFLLRKSPNILFVISIILYVFGLVAKAYSETPVGMHVDFNTRNGPFFSTIFFVTGYFLSKIKTDKFFKNGIIFFSAGIIMHFIEIFVLWKYYDISPIQDYVVGTYFMGIGISLLALSDHYIFNKFINVSKTGKLVIGIYLIHFIFVDNLRPLKDIYRPVSDLMYIILVFTFSYYGVFLLCKSSVLRSILFCPTSRST